MRIRKHASMIIGSASSFGWLSPAAPPPALAAADHPDDVCSLNRSPWDVMASFSNSDHSDPEDLGLLQVDDGESIGSQQILMQGNIRTIPCLLEDEINDRPKRNKKIKKKDVAMSKECCKKNDGKGWRCKKPAQLPHTLCRYHLAQLRSYGDSHKAPTAAPSARACRKSTTAKAGAVTDFYYYSEFGPWRGKKRSEDNKVVNGDGGEKHLEEKEEDYINDESLGDCAGIDGCDDDSVEDKIDADEDERKKEADGDGGGGGRRRGRKRIKARSLKSLL